MRIFWLHHSIHSGDIFHVLKFTCIDGFIYAFIGAHNTYEKWKKLFGKRQRGKLFEVEFEFWSQANSMGWILHWSWADLMMRITPTKLVILFYTVRDYYDRWKIILKFAVLWKFASLYLKKTFRTFWKDELLFRVSEEVDPRFWLEDDEKSWREPWRQLQKVCWFSWQKNQWMRRLNLSVKNFYL